MRVAAFAILCCVLQHVTPEIIEDKFHNILNDRNKYETKNVSTSDEFDLDLKTGQIFEKKTVHKEFVLNNENCDDIHGDDVKIMKIVIEKDAKGRERIYEEDTIIKKVDIEDNSDKDIGTTPNKNSDKNSTNITPATSAQNNTAESQNSEKIWIASKPSIVIINEEVENTSTSASKTDVYSSEADSSGQENINDDETASNTATDNKKASENGWEPAGGILIPQKLVILNENEGFPGSNSSPDSPTDKDSAGKKPTDIASKSSVGENTYGSKDGLGPGGIYRPYGSQLPSILIKNKYTPVSASLAPKDTTGADQSGSRSETKGSKGDASPTKDRNAGETSGPNVYGQDYYGNHFNGQDYLYPRKLVILNENEGSSGSNSSPDSPTSKDSAGKKPTDAASKPEAGGSTHGSKKELGPGDIYGPYGGQLPSILIKNKNKPGSASLAPKDTTGADQSGSGSETKGSKGDASPTKDRNAGETSGPNVYGQYYHRNRFYGQDYLYPRKLVILNENEGSSGSNASPDSPTSKDSAEKKPTDAASKPSAGGSTHGSKKELGLGDIYGPYGGQLPSILIKNKNKPGSASLAPKDTTGADQSGSGSETKGSKGDASPTKDRNAGETSGPNVYGQDYYGNHFNGQDYLYPRKLVILNENEGSSGSNSSPDSPTSKDSAGKKPTDAASKPEAGGSTHGSKKELGSGDIYGPYGGQLPSILIKNKNKPGSASLAPKDTTGADQSGSGSETKGSKGDASPTKDRNAGETSGPNVYGQYYHRNRFYGQDYLYPRKLVILNENEGSSGSNASPDSPTSKDSAEKKPTDAASKPSAGGSTHGSKKELGLGDIYGPYGGQLPSILIKNKNKPGSASLAPKDTTGADQSGSGSETKGSKGDASPTKDRNAGETSGPNVYGQDYYGNHFNGQDYLYPRKLVILNENEGSSGSNSSPDSPTSKDSAGKKPTDAASKPEAGGSTHGSKKELGPGDIYGPYGGQLPSILIKNKYTPASASHGDNGTTGAGQSDKGSGTKGPEDDASPTEDLNLGDISGPNVYGEYYYGDGFYGQDNLYPQKLVILNENEGSSGSNSSPDSPTSKDSAGKKPTDAASKPEAGGSTHGSKKELGPGDIYGPYGGQLPSILIKNKNKPGSASLAPKDTTGADQSGSGSETKGSKGDASPTKDRNAGETSGPNVYGQDYYGNHFNGQDYLYPRKLVILNENQGSSGSNSSPDSPTSKDSAGKKPTDAASKPEAGGSTHGSKKELGPGDIYGPYGRQLPSILIKNKNKPGSASLAPKDTTGADQSGSGSETKGSKGDASPTKDRNAGETSGPNVYGQYYHGNRFYGQDYLYPRKLVILNENEGSSGSNASPDSPTSKDSAEKKPTDAASKPSAGGSTHGSKKELGLGDIYGPYGGQLPSILIKNKNKPGSASLAPKDTTGADQSGSGSETKGSKGDASPTKDRNAGETSGPNVYGQDYYGNHFNGQDYLYPRKLVILNENEGSSGSNSSPDSPTSKDSAGKKPTDAASKPEARGSTHGSKKELGPGDIYGPYGGQLPSILIKNKNKPGSASLAPKDTTGADQSGSGSETKGSKGDASPTKDRNAGETSGSNVYGQYYHRNRFYGQDYLYPRKLVILNENEGSSGSNASPDSPTSKDSAEKKPTDAASKPSAGGSTHGSKKELELGDMYGPYGGQLPSILIKNKNKPGSASLAPKDTTGADQSGSGSETKGSKGDASPTKDRNAGETSGPNVYGQDYYGNHFNGQDYLYPRKLVILNENEGSSGSNSSPDSPTSKDSAGKKPTDAASKPEARGSTHGSKKELGPGDIYGPYGGQLPSILIKNKNKPGSASLAPKDTTGADQSGSRSETKGSKGDASPTKDRNAGETSGSNVYGQDYYGNHFYGQDYLYPRKLVILNENEGSSGSNSSPDSPTSKDSAGKKPTDAASKPSAGGSTHGSKKELGLGDIYGPYGGQLPSILIKNKNKPGSASLAPKDTTGADQSGSGSETKGSKGDASPTKDRNAGETSGPNVYGQDYYGNHFNGQDYLYPRKLVILNENEGSSGSNASPDSPTSKDSAEKKPTDAASKPAAGGSTHGSKKKLGLGDIYGPYGGQLPSILIKNKNKPGSASLAPKDTTGAGQSDKGSGTKGPEDDASPTEDLYLGDISGPNVYGQDYYGDGFYGQDNLYPQKLVILNENEGSSGSNSSPDSPTSKDSAGKKPTDAASKPAAGGSTHGSKKELGPGDIYGPYGGQLPSILIKNKNKPGSASLAPKDTTGADQSGSRSETKGSKGDASPTKDRNAGETSGPNVYGQDYYGNHFNGQDYLYPRKLVILNENEGSSGSNSSPDSPTSKDSAGKKPTDAASKPEAGGSTHGSKKELGPGDIYGPYGGQLPSILIKNKNKPGSASLAPKDTTGADQSGSGSETKGSKGDASPTKDRNAGETSGPNVYGQYYHRNRFYGQDYLYPRKLVILNENEGSSGSNASPDSPTSKDSAEKKPTDAASKPSAGGSTHGSKKELGLGDIYGPYGGQLPSILIKNKNKPGSASLAPKDTTGADQSGSGSETKGSKGDASPTKDRNAGETSGPNVYGQDYYGNHFNGQDYLYPRKLVILNENEGSSGSNASPDSPTSKDSAERKPTDAASKPSAGGSTHGSKKELGPGDIYGPYGGQLPSILIKNKNKPGSASLAPKDTTGADQSGSGSETKGSKGDASPTKDRNAGETSGPNVYGQYYHRNRFYGQDYLYPRKLVILNENEGSSGSNASPDSPTSKDSAEKKPTDAASKPSAGGSTHGSKKELGLGDIYGPYGGQLPSILIKNKNKPGSASLAPKDTTGADQSGSGSETKRSKGDASPTKDRNAGETSGPNVYGQDYYGNHFNGQDYLYPRKLVILNENEGSSGSNSSPDSPTSKDSAEKKPTDAASKPSAGGSTHGSKQELGLGDIYGPYGGQLPSILIKNKNKPGSASLAPKDTTGADQSGSGSETKGSKGDASPTKDRNAGETSGSNVYGQDYYGNHFNGQDYLYPRKLVILNENEGSSGSNASPDSPTSKNSAERKPTDAASKPAACGSTHGSKKELGPGDIYGPYGGQLPSILIKNKNKPGSASLAPKDTTGADQSGSGSRTKGSNRSATSDHASGQKIQRIRQACRLRRRHYSVRLGRKGQSCEGC